MTQPLNQYIDQTLLTATACPLDIIRLCQEAIKFNFYAVCVNPCYVTLAKANLANSQVKVCTVVGFPLGANTNTIKLQETEKAISDGADEIDMVINIGQLKAGNLEYVLGEIQALRNLCQKQILKVIIECSALNEQEKETACKLVVAGKADFVKTSTGFGTSGAQLKDVENMKKWVENKILIKASGGIKNKAQMLALIKAGANRIGTSAGTIILNDQEVKNDTY